MGESHGVLCPSCRKLISSEETTCPYCGAKRPNALSGFQQVLFRQDATMMITNLSVAIFVLSLLIEPSSLLQIDLSSLGGLLGLGSPSALALHLLGMTGGLAWSCGHWWTLLTASLLHGSLLHIFFNMYWLRLLGPLAAREFGTVRFLLLYFLAGAGGFLLSNFWDASPTIGASCSIFGLMGALFIYGRRSGGRFGESLSRQMAIWAFVNFLLGLMIPHVNNAGHAGGFISGLVIGALVPTRTTPAGRPLQLLALALILTTAAGFILSMWKMWVPFTTGLAICS